VIVVVIGSILMGFLVITIVSATSKPPPKVGEDRVGGIDLPADRFYDQVETLLQRQGMIIEQVEQASDGMLFQAFDPTPVRGARVLILARSAPPGTPMSLEDVSGLSDSLRGHDAVKGVFITTAGFLPDAAAGETAYRLELVDGERWLEICAEHAIS
jgi:restriction system protein